MASDNAMSGTEHIEGGPENCPACLSTGEKTPRVGTFKCTNRECRVHFYQQGVLDR